MTDESHLATLIKVVMIDDNHLATLISHLAVYIMVGVYIFVAVGCLNSFCNIFTPVQYLCTYSLFEVRRDELMKNQRVEAWPLD